MKNRIDPYEIKKIESNTPITITMEDGSTFTAYNFEFINKVSIRSTDDSYDGNSVEVHND